MSKLISKIDELISILEGNSSSDEKPRFTLGYWAIRGLAEPIRLFFAYKNIPYENKLYEDGQEWFNKDKKNLELDFPNIPYLIDHKKNVKITQSQTILRYLCREYNLISEKDPELVHEEMIGDCVDDIRAGFGKLCYNPKYNDELKNEYIKNLTTQLDLFEKWLGDSNHSQWLISNNRLSYCDFRFYELLDAHLRLDSHILDQFPKLKNYHHNFRKLNGIEQYVNNPKNALPINNPHYAKFY